MADAFAAATCYASGGQAVRFTDAKAKERDMDVNSLVIFIVVGIVAGFLAGVIVRGYGLGLVGNLVVGGIGAFLAGWLLPRLGVSFTLVNPLVTSICYATIGAIVLLLLVGLV